MKEEDPARAAVVLLIALPAEKVLMLKRSPDGPNPETWCFPGGGCRPDETFPQTALRELKEETGIEIPGTEIPDDPRIIQLVGLTIAAFQAGLMIMGDEGSVEDIGISLSDEHTEFGWFTREEALALDLAGPFTKQLLEEMEMPDQPTIGATGEFPRGQIEEFDEGELNIQMAVDMKNNIVRIDFGKKVKWIGFDPDTSEKFARMLLAKSAELRARVNVH